MTPPPPPSPSAYPSPPPSRQALAGAIGPATNWRVPFVVVAAPSLMVALVMLLTTREPPRGAFEEALRET